LSQPESQHAGLELRHESWTARASDHQLLALRAHRVAIYSCREMLRLGNARKSMQARERWLGLGPAGDAMHRCSSLQLIGLHERLSRASHD